MFLTGDDSSTRWLWKIGDFGHAVQLGSVNQTLDLDEGDCRYLSREVLEHDLSDLCKADIFALGLTAYEALGSGPLPKNGPDWHQIRAGTLTQLERASHQLHSLLLAMIHPAVKQRPSAINLTLHSTLVPAESCPSYDQLRAQLSKERLKNERLQRRLEAMQKGSVTPGMILRPLDGKVRSRSSQGRRTLQGDRISYSRSHSSAN